jgi:hypothetical protein
MIRCFFERDHLKWDEYVPQLAGGIRAMPNRNTGFSPNLLMLGRKVLGPADILFLGAVSGTQGEIHEHAASLLERIQSVYEVARKHLGHAQVLQKITYDLRASESKFEVGDVVYALNTTRAPGVGSKCVVGGKNHFWFWMFCHRWSSDCVVHEVHEQGLHQDRVKLCGDWAILLWLRRL